MDDPNTRVDIWFKWGCFPMEITTYTKEALEKGTGIAAKFVAQC